MFRNWVFQYFPFLENDFDALTDYELFCKICSYVIEYSKDNEEMKAKILEFQNYFDNLDVQEEINNKLDEMAEDGTLDEIINQNIFEDLNNKIDNNKSHQLSDNVQSFKSNIDLSTTFPDDYGISGFVFTNINSVTTGIVVANDWSAGGSGGNKFTIKTFTYINDVISDLTIKQALVDGHSNDICLIDDTHLLIIAMTHNYVYDIINNTLTEITQLIPYCRSCASYNNKIYLVADYDHSTDAIVNAIYEIQFNELYVPSVVSTKTLENLYDYLKMQNQGMVIYEDLIIFPSYNDVRLIIYDFNTLKHLKTQVFTAPYMAEYENGFVYNNKLLLNDGKGVIYEPDIYGKRTYGDYNNNTIARSVSDICLYDDIIKLDGNENREITINFNNFLSFSANPNTNKGTLGSMLESITMYVAIRNYKTSNVVHNAIPIEIPLYKNIEYENDVFNSLEKHFETSYTNFNENNNTYTRSTISGIYYFGGGDSIPTLRLRLAPYILNETFNTDGTSSHEIITDSSYTPEVYITKIIGHRKVGLKY